MRLAPETFDTPDLYTTPWSAPYGQGLTRWRHSLGWEDTPTGATIVAALEARGLTEDHVGLATSGRTIMVSWSGSIGEVAPLVLPVDRPPDLGKLHRLLDLSTASIARETLMRHVGWQSALESRTASRPPPWALLTTPIMEAMLAAADTDSHSVWALAREDGEFSVTLRPFGQAKIDLLRHGAALLVSWAEVSPGIFVLQDRCTSIHAFEPANVDAAKALGPDTRLGDLLDVSASPVADALAGLPVRSVRTGNTGTHIVFEVGVPMINMAPMPIDLASRFVGRDVGEDELAFPLWASAVAIEWPGGGRPPYAGSAVAAPQASASDLALALSSVPDVQASVMASLDRQPAHVQGEFAGVLTRFFAHRLRHDGALAALATEHPTFSGVWMRHYMHHLDPDAHPTVRGYPLPGSPTHDEAQRTRRILKIVYDELLRAGVRMSSPFDEGWDSSGALANGDARVRIAPAS